MVSRREILSRTAALVAGGAAYLGLRGSSAQAQTRAALTARGGYTSVVTPNVGTLPWRIENGVKVYHLVAQKVHRTFTDGLEVDTWGYNGSTPGPTIEAVEGDRVRILVTNELPAGTAVHWHGLHVPNGMDGVGGLTQPEIAPGQTFAYEFTLRQHGTFMYHPHVDETVQLALGMMGFFVVHPKSASTKIDRDFCIFLHEWAIAPGTSTPDPNVMTDFNYFSFNGRVFPGTAPLVVKKGDRVRIRFGNVSMDSHPIHLHGHTFQVTGTDGGPIPASARWPETTVNVPPGTTRDVEFVADNEGDWPLHCHKAHHTMNAMAHELPNMIGVDQTGVADKIAKLVPGYMPMGTKGMGEMAEMQAHMPGPPNTPPMMAGRGRYGRIGMGGMFTLLKVRANLTSDADPGLYEHPEGTVARPV
ncbi:copper oxidase [Myxococcota bacterium]|nr:copper oxidase [Myxococcota bacterium]